MIRRGSIYGLVIAGFVALAGLLMLLDEEPPITPTNELAFDAAGPDAWAALFIGSSIWFAVLRRHHLAAVPLCFSMTAWASMLAWASLHSDAASVTAWIWPMIVATLLVVAVARRDI